MQFAEGNYLNCTESIIPIALARGRAIFHFCACKQTRATHNADVTSSSSVDSNSWEGHLALATAINSSSRPILGRWRPENIAAKFGKCARGLTAIVTAVLAIVLAPSAAQAVTVYSYAGNNFTTPYDTSPPSGAYDTSMSVSGSFTLAAPLVANLTYPWNITASVLSFSFFDGRSTITNLDVDFSLTHFFVSTNAAGNITSWDIALTIPVQALGEQGAYIQTSNTSSLIVQDIGMFGVCVEDIPQGCTTVSADVAFVRDTPGSWVVGNVSATPLPAALPLFAGGLCAVGLLARRRKRRTTA